MWRGEPLSCLGGGAGSGGGGGGIGNSIGIICICSGCVWWRWSEWWRWQGHAACPLAAAADCVSADKMSQQEEPTLTHLLGNCYGALWMDLVNASAVHL
jgi:hypothetical protein